MDVGQPGGGAQTDADAGIERADPGLTWDDLVLPDEQVDHLRSIAEHLRERRAAGQDTGTPIQPVLFLGAAGTGKTMAARILAADVDAPIHTLDLADALARGRPELQRVTARAFQRADRVGAVLVIDGAAVLLRRSVVLGRHESVLSPTEQSADTDEAPEPVIERLAPRLHVDDGPAPTEPGAAEAIGGWLLRLLARADRYDGLVIFTSTETHGIDPALLDRFGATVAFPLPEPEARKEIWRRSLPADAELTESNLDYLSGWLQWPGGTIHRCCLAAAHEAAEEGVPVQLRHVAGVLGQGYRHDSGLANASTEPPAGARSPGMPPTEPRRSRLAGTPVSTADPAASQPTAARPSGPSTPVPAPVGPGPSPASPVARTSPPQAGRRWPLAVALALIAAVLIGGIIALMASHTSRPRATRAASTGSLRLSFPSSWRQSAPASRPAYGLTRELAVVSPAPAGGELVIGETVQNQTSVLPPPLQATVPATATPQIVKIGQLTFYRYPGSPGPGGSATHWIYAMPTTTGTVIGVCTPQRASSAFTSSCIRVLATLRLTSGRALPLTLSTTYARQLNAAISRLNLVRSSAGAHLATAKTGPTQAAAATQLAQAHREAASALGRLSAGVAAAANAALARALLLSADAYSTLAQAAVHHDTRAFSTARADLTRSAQAVSLAFEQLRRLGYQVA